MGLRLVVPIFLRHYWDVDFYTIPDRDRGGKSIWTDEKLITPLMTEAALKSMTNLCYAQVYKTFKSFSTLPLIFMSIAHACITIKGVK